MNAIWEYGYCPKCDYPLYPVWNREIKEVNGIFSMKRKQEWSIKYLMCNYCGYTTKKKE